MYFNYGYERWLFEEEQKELRNKYIAAGMDETAIEKMYEFDMAYFNLRRKEARHAATFQEMSVSDSETGELRRKDMDEFPAKDTVEHHSFNEDTWISEIENPLLFNMVNSLTPDNKKILYWVIIGMTQSQIAMRLGISQPAISQRMAVLKKKLE